MKSGVWILSLSDMCKRINVKWIMTSHLCKTMTLLIIDQMRSNMAQKWLQIAWINGWHRQIIGFVEADTCRCSLSLSLSPLCPNKLVFSWNSWKTSTHRNAYICPSTRISTALKIAMGQLTLFYSICVYAGCFYLFHFKCFSNERLLHYTYPYLHISEIWNLSTAPSSTSSFDGFQNVGISV